MLLIHPPLAKPCEPPAGLPKLAGALRGHGVSCTMLDANLEGLLWLLKSPPAANDTWSRRACRNLKGNLDALRNPTLYTNTSRYQRAIQDLNRVLERIGLAKGLNLSLSNYQDPALSPLKSQELLQAADTCEDNIFFPFFAARLPQLIEKHSTKLVGISLNYLSQSLTTFAMLGFLKKHYPQLPVVLGGGLVTSWLRNPGWQDPFVGLVDHMVAGPGEKALLALLGREMDTGQHSPDFQDLPLTDYLAPGFILPYAASSGCYWNKCTFCPEKAEENPYQVMAVKGVLDDLEKLEGSNAPGLIHLLDNAVSPALMQGMAARNSQTPWYGFARVSPILTDRQFCQQLRESGCLMLKLGLESGDQNVLDAMHKGIDLDMVAKALGALHEAGIATYVYLLFGTPSESLAEARRTLEFTVRHQQAITFLNLAIFSMPVCGPEAKSMATQDFYEGDLSLYTDFNHPRGWSRKQIRQFLDKEFKRHPAVAAILRNDPPLFTSNHAPFFC